MSSNVAAIIKSPLCYNEYGAASQLKKDGKRSEWTKKFITYCMELQYYIVFIPKYRKKNLYGQVRVDVREIIRTLYNYKRVEIVEGAVCTDHVHLCVCIPLKMSISSFMGYLKGKSTLMVYGRHPNLQSKWNKAFWARCYYVAMVGNLTEEDAIKKYIQEQSEESRREDREGAAF